MEENFLDAQRAANGYQATGQARFLRSYQIEQGQVEAELGQVRRLASAGVLSEVTAQAVSDDHFLPFSGRRRLDGFRGLATGQLDADGARERFAAALLAAGFDSGEPR